MSTLILLTPFIIIGFIFVYLPSNANTAPYPPGPSGDPVIGHVRAMSVGHTWKMFADWSQKFGDVIYLHVFGRPIVVLNSLQAARDLLDNRGINYSDRPRLVLFNLMGWGGSTFVLPYGERLRGQRRLLHQHFNPQAIISLRSLQRDEVHVLLSGLLESPDRFQHHIHRANSATVLRTTYGHQVNSDDDPFVESVIRAAKLTVEWGEPGGALVDLIPPLRHIPSWMPGAGFKRHAIKTRKAVQETMDWPFQFVKKGRIAGTAPPSFVSNILEEYEQQNTVDREREDDLKALSGILYSAAVEAMSSVLQTFFLAMVIHPEVSKKAREEIDRVVGPDRLPDFEDREHLPYIDCIIREALRWNPPTPLGLPHCSTKSDIYQGMQIPGGSMIIPNMWYMMRNKEIYSNPEEFSPDRFLKLSGEDDDFDPKSVVFGFGRRICPGRYFADASLWLAMACVLAAFDILPPLDEDGRENVPAAEFTSQMTSKPAPFQCRIIPRSSKYASVIRKNALPLA